MSTEVHQAAETVTTSNELDLIFGPLFDEYFNGENQVVLKSSAVTTTDASNKRQQQPDSTSSTSTLATTVTANGNFDFLPVPLKNTGRYPLGKVSPELVNSKRPVPCVYTGWYPTWKVIFLIEEIAEIAYETIKLKLSRFESPSSYPDHLVVSYTSFSHCSIIPHPCKKKLIALVTSLKALDESFSIRNHVRKFLRALPTKWRPKVMAIEESKDLSTLLLDELIGNLKEKKVSSNEEVSCSDSDDEEYAMVVRDFKKFFRRRWTFVRQPYDDKKNLQRAKEEKKGKEERSEEDDDSKKDENYLMAHDTNEKDKEISVECKSCIELHTKIDSLSLKLAKFENSSHFLLEMIENKRLQKEKKGLGFTKDKALTSEVKIGKMGQESAKVPSVEPAPTVPSTMVSSSENAWYRGTASAKEILELILQNRSEFVQVRLKVKLEPNEWVKDSGCSRHITGYKDLFSTNEAINEGNVVFGSNTKSKIIGKDEEDEKELVEMGEVGEGPFGEGEGGERGRKGTVVAGVDRDRDAEKEEI
ncbi:zf-CCHC domain-containing protein [Tanacetum coccineum]